MSDLPLLDYIDSAQARAEVRASNAAGRAERIEPGWRSAAIEAVRVYAMAHEYFPASHVPMSIPPEADKRASGAIMPAARRLGYVVADGLMLDKFSSWKTRWRSLIYGGAA